MTLRVRPLSTEEQDQLAHLARCRKRGAGLVRRAQIVVHAVDGLSAPEIATTMDLCDATVRFWLKRFNERGLAGLEEGVRSGRPPTYSAEEKSTVIRTALTRPDALGLPFACWTLDRLVAYLSEQGIGMRRSRISEVLLDEGLKWRQEETWFGERVDPDFAKKREPSSNSIPHPPPAVSSSVWTRWGHKRARAIPVSGWSPRPDHRRNAPVRRLIMAAAVWPAMSLARFSPPPVRPSRHPTRDERAPTGSTS